MDTNFCFDRHAPHSVKPEHWTSQGIWAKIPEDQKEIIQVLPVCGLYTATVLNTSSDGSVRVLVAWQDTHLNLTVSAILLFDSAKEAIYDGWILD